MCEGPPRQEIDQFYLPNAFVATGAGADGASLTRACTVLSADAFAAIGAGAADATRAIN